MVTQVDVSHVRFCHQTVKNKPTIYAFVFGTLTNYDIMDISSSLIWLCLIQENLHPLFVIVDIALMRYRSP